MDEAACHFESIAKALADPQRFAIFEHICRFAKGDGDVGGGRREVACKAIVARFSVSQATISHHLKELKYAGLIEGRREGQCLMLSPKAGAVEAYVDHLRCRLLSASGTTASGKMSANSDPTSAVAPLRRG